MDAATAAREAKAIHTGLKALLARDVWEAYKEADFQRKKRVSFLAEEGRFWVLLVQRLQRAYGVFVPSIHANANLTEDEVDNAADSNNNQRSDFPALAPVQMGAGTARAVLAKALVCLRDIARYREQFRGGKGGKHDLFTPGALSVGITPTNNKSFACPAALYTHAQCLYPRARALGIWEFSFLVGTSYLRRSELGLAGVTPRLRWPWSAPLCHSVARWNRSVGPRIGGDVLCAPRSRGSRVCGPRLALEILVFALSKLRCPPRSRGCGVPKAPAPDVYNGAAAYPARGQRRILQELHGVIEPTSKTTTIKTRVDALHAILRTVKKLGSSKSALRVYTRSMGPGLGHSHHHRLMISRCVMSKFDIRRQARRRMGFSIEFFRACDRSVNALDGV
ncbi:hypothetical protein C8J57DRAFT_1475171 [Mycena rebaudengoi]|nr:hypothetical protein C8J57DRAFT_1475171 [Mycena rebaudengoi]